MSGLIFLDTETTGLELFTDRLFQVCYSFKGEVLSQYFKPSLPISVKAQSITHVTNKMVADKIPFSESEMKKDLIELLQENILVAHNAAFDNCMLANEGVHVQKYICTLKVARFLDSEGLIPEYNMQYLRYHHALDIEAVAHSAEGDVVVLEAVFKKLYEQMFDIYQDHDYVINKMIEISSQPSLFKTFNFGKYRGQKINDVIRTDKKYVNWLLVEKMKNEKSEEDWIYSLKYFLSNGE